MLAIRALARRRRQLGVGLALLLSAAPLAAQVAAPPRPATARAATAPSSARYQAAIDSGRAVLRTLMTAQGIPGLSVAVIVDGDIVWSEGFGFADLENRVPATPLTRFRIGSISKPVTAEAVGLLVEQGKLDLDVPVQTYVPDYPRQRWPITTRQVAGHQAGIRHYANEAETLSSRHYDSVREALGIFEHDTLLFEPGTRYSYSSYGFNLLSAVVEGATGQPFLTYMRSHVFAPLGLHSIVAGHVDSIVPWRAHFYERGRDGRVTNAPYVDLSNKWAGGGFISNSEDVARFGWSHVEGGILKPATVTLLTTPQALRSGERTDYGLGWFSGADSAGRHWYGHTGSSTGGRAVLVVFPEQRVVVAALANLGQAPMSTQLASRLAGPFVAARAAGR